MVEYSNILEDILFPSFICSCVPSINLKELKNESYQIQKEVKCNKISNEGGYQSLVLEDEKKYPSFDQLREIVKQFAQDIVNHKRLDVRLRDCYWWININKSHHYNVLHHHGRADLVAVYYIQAPSGDLVLVRSDGSEYGNLYKNTANFELKRAISADVGRLYLFPGYLWHYVNSSESEMDRISVSFNLYFD